MLRKSMIIMITLIITLILVTGCSEIDSPDNVKSPKNIKWEDRKVSVTDSYGWSSFIAENSDYYFYISNKKIKRLDKKTNDEIIVATLDEKKNEDYLLYFHENKLYFTDGDSYGDSVYSIDLDGENRKIVMPKNRITNIVETPGIWDLKNYNDDIYTLVTGLEVIQYDINEKKSDSIVQNIGSSCFIGDFLYYSDRDYVTIYKINLDTKEKSIIKGKENLSLEESEENGLYNIFEHDNNLYYINGNEQMYKYNESGDDELVYELSKECWSLNSVYGKDAIYLVYYDSSDENIYLCRYDVSSKKSSKMSLPDDVAGIGGIIDKTLFYMVSDSEDEYLPYYKCISVEKLLTD